MSLDSPEIPSKPDCVFRSVSTSDGDIPSFVATRFTIAGSRSPERVPITRPSSGVMPMEVSTEFPWRLAVAEHAVPRWSLLRLVWSHFFKDTATTEIYTLPLHDALPTSLLSRAGGTRQ